MMTLADLRRGESARLTSLDLPGEVADFVMEAGFIPGAAVTLLNRAPGGGPFIYSVDGAEIAIRRDVATGIRVERER
jgi:Fe2+ transport system protein FeoA